MNQRNNKKQSHTQLDSRKQVIAFQDRVITINIKEGSTPTKTRKTSNRQIQYVENFDKIHALSASFIVSRNLRLNLKLVGWTISI